MRAELVADLARRLEREYGPLRVTNRALISEAFSRLAGGRVDGELRARFVDVAESSRAADYWEWLNELRALVSIYRGEGS